MTEKKYQYDHGLPFTKPLEEDVDFWMEERIDKKKPCVILIVGNQGDGKTTLAVHLADYANKKPIIFEKQLALGGKDFRKKLDKAFVEKHRVVIYDEAGDYTNIGFATRFNRIMNQVFNMNRAFAALIIVVLPEVDEISKKILRSTRGLLRVYDRNENYSNFEAYDYASTRYLVSYMKDRVIEESAYKSVWSEYKGHFLNLPPEREKELDKYCMAGKRDIFHQQEIKEKELHSIKELAELCSRSTRWVRKHLADNHFVHAKTYKSKKYYSKSILQALLKEINGEE